MEIYKIFLILILSFAVLLVISYFQDKRTKQLISDYLRSRGATMIVISDVWFDMDKTTNTYDVEYFNSQGAYRINSCKIRTGFFGSREIYWRDPL
jgi:hypothetical protein